MLQGALGEGGGGLSSPFIMVGGEPRRRQQPITAGVVALMPLMAGVVKEGVKPGV
jgi:hypothetical protein